MPLQKIKRSTWILLTGITAAGVVLAAGVMNTNHLKDQAERVHAALVACGGSLPGVISLDDLPSIEPATPDELKAQADCRETVGVAPDAKTIPGKTLYSRLNELPLSYEEASVIVGKVAVALADLHRQNVIHHDIKPSSIMFRSSGEAVLIDFGLSHHNQLPDLLQEEFRLPYGTAPYMAPERLLGVRDDPRSDLFSLGVLLYFFTTGVRPFGEGETMRGMRRRLWRDPYPPRKLKPDYPPWLQEVVLRCLEIEPVWRYPTASQLAFELAHPDQIKLTARSERLDRDPISTVWRRRFNGNPAPPRGKSDVAAQLASGPIVAIALDTTEGSLALNEALRVATARILSTLPSARLACLNVLKLGRVTLDRTLDEQGNNKHVDRLVGAAALGRAVKTRRKPAHRACARGRRSRRGDPGICRSQSCRSYRDRGAAEFAGAHAAWQRLGQGGGRSALQRHRGAAAAHGVAAAARKCRREAG